MTNELDDLILKTTLEVADALVERGWLLATAESCTGGWIAKCCTDPAGSSRWFDRGYVSYSYEAKEEQLGVIGPDLESHGAVSEEIAAQMALLARQRSGVQFTLAATGIAGPDGGMPNSLFLFDISPYSGITEAILNVSVLYVLGAGCTAAVQQGRWAGRCFRRCWRSAPAIAGIPGNDESAAQDDHLFGCRVFHLQFHAFHDRYKRRNSTR